MVNLVPDGVGTVESVDTLNKIRELGLWFHSCKAWSGF